MEIRYQIPQAEFAEILHLASLQVDKENKKIKYLKLADFALFIPYFALILILFLTSRDWIYFFNRWYENNYVGWIRWILLIGICVIFCYATIIRPSIEGNIFCAQIMDRRWYGEQILRIQEDGLYGQNPLVQALYAYSYISQVQNIKQYLVVFVGGVYFIAVPHNAFQDENHRLEFENLLRAKIADQSEAV